MWKSKFIPVLVAVVALSGCSTIEKSAVAGGVTGAAVGGVVGHQYDDAVKGAAIGGLGGTFAGIYLGKKKEKTEFEKGFDAGYKQGQSDYAKYVWEQKTGKCGGEEPNKETVSQQAGPTL